MAIGNITALPVESAGALITEVGKIGNWLQALGIIVIIWIIVQIVNFVFNTKRKERLESIEKRLVTIDRKINKLTKKK